MKKNNVYSTIIALIFLIFLFPIGLILMWKWEIGKKPLRLVITLLVVFFIRHLLVLNMIFYGRFIYPEASLMLYHYCFGDGTRLTLDSDYLKRSPVILGHIKKMKIGEKRKIGVHQWEDFRLSYGLNPFILERRGEKVTITEFIQFDNSGKVFTWVGPIPIPDNIVHVFACTPYHVYAEFNYKEVDFNDADPPNFVEKYFMEKAKKKGWVSGRNYRVIK